MISFFVPKKFELLLWKITPALIAFSFFLFCTIKKYVWGINLAITFLPLIPIFYWGYVQLAEEIPIWFAFLIGLLTDAVSGSPLFGLSALLYMLFLMFIKSRSNQLKKEGFVFLWFYFAISLFALCLLQFVTISIFEKRLYDISLVVFQCVLTIGLYPFFHKLFDKINEKCQQRRWILFNS